MLADWTLYLALHWQAISLWVVFICCLISLTYGVVVNILRMPISYSLLYWMSMATAFMFVLLAIYLFNHTVIHDVSQMRQVVLTLINASFLVGIILLLTIVSIYIHDWMKNKQTLKGK